MEGLPKWYVNLNLNLARFYSCTILTVLSYVFIRIPDFGVGTTIVLPRRYLP